MQFGKYVLKFAFFANMNAALEMTRESFLKEACIIVLFQLSFFATLISYFPGANKSPSSNDAAQSTTLQLSSFALTQRCKYALSFTAPNS